MGCRLLSVTYGVQPMGYNLWGATYWGHENLGGATYGGNDGGMWWNLGGATLWGATFWGAPEGVQPMGCIL